MVGSKVRRGEEGSVAWRGVAWRETCVVTSGNAVCLHLLHLAWPARVNYVHRAVGTLFTIHLCLSFYFLIINSLIIC